MFSSPGSLIDHYRRLSDLSDEMLRSAQEQGWSQLMGLGQRYVAALESLRTVDRSTPLKPEDTILRQILLLRILDNDARTRRLIDPSIGRVEDMIGAIGVSEHLLRTFGQDDAQQ